jgi:hypothetical protein
MRVNDLNGGSIKTLLILVLVAANIALSFPPGGARVSRSRDTVLAITNFHKEGKPQRNFVSAEPQKSARATRALPEASRP